MKKAIGLLRLARPANLVTAVSDILAGIAISGYFSNPNIAWSSVLLLTIATIGLYGGGVVFNDVFDAELDATERPERPIPSGLITKKQAAIWGIMLLLLGSLAVFVHFQSLIIAVLIVIAALVYDKFGKHHYYLGPLNMGVCRGLNLLLGISIIPNAVYEFAPLAVIPIIYIAAITMISRGEVHGSSKKILYVAFALYSLVILGILSYSVAEQNYVFTLPFLILFALLIFPALIQAVRIPEGKFIGKAVKAGVIALIAMNASWAAAFEEPYIALFTLALLPVSIYLGKLFAVT